MILAETDLITTIDHHILNTKELMSNSLMINDKAKTDFITTIDHHILNTKEL